MHDATGVRSYGGRGLESRRSSENEMKKENILYYKNGSFSNVFKSNVSHPKSFLCINSNFDRPPRHPVGSNTRTEEDMSSWTIPSASRPYQFVSTRHQRDPATNTPSASRATPSSAGSAHNKDAPAMFSPGIKAPRQAGSQRTRRQGRGSRHGQGKGKPGAAGTFARNARLVQTSWTANTNTSFGSACAVLVEDPVRIANSTQGRCVADQVYDLSMALDGLRRRVERSADVLRSVAQVLRGYFFKFPRFSVSRKPHGCGQINNFCCFFKWLLCSVHTFSKNSKFKTHGRTGLFENFENHVSVASAKLQTMASTVVPSQCPSLPPIKWLSR